MPIFRTDTQLQILGATYLEPERQFTIPELITRLQPPQPKVAREVDRLVEGGLLESELRGGRRAVWVATTSPIFDELRSILLKTIGPKAILHRRREHRPRQGRFGSRVLGRDVDVTVLSPAGWAAAGSEFIAHLEDGPLAELDLTK